MSEILERNFEGDEMYRLLMDTKAPKYGNDDDEADTLARDILSCFSSGVMELNKPEERDKYVSTLFGYFFHIYHGEITGATPNGRRRGETFSDSMGPGQGKDDKGPAKMHNSVLKLDHKEVTGGYALNLKLNRELVQSEAGKRALKGLLKGYLRDGGPQIQINFVDAESLRRAMEDPREYRNLIVRIGGYCEYFVNLDRALQEEIITRTIHGSK
jgi:formate C-acetyltransferase